MTVLADHKISTLLVLFALSTGVYAASAPTAIQPAANATSANTAGKAAAPAGKPSMETQIANLTKQVSTQTTRLNQLEAANQEALAKNQTLQLENDNLKVQVKVLQSDRGAQMFIYGAVAILIGALIGYICANYFSRRNRRW